MATDYLDVDRRTYRINVLAYGAKGDGVSDDTIPIANACAAAAALRNLTDVCGVTVVFPGPGPYITSSLPAYSFLRYLGDGGSMQGLTMIKLKAGTNADLFSYNTGAINLSNTTYGSGSTDAVQCFTLENLHLHGNKTQQTAGPSYPFRVYGAGYRLVNCYFTDGYSGGFITDYGNIFPTASNLEAQMSDVKILYNNGIGAELGGPSDSQWTNAIIAYNGSHDLHILPMSTGLQLSNCHFWYPGVINGNSVGILAESDFHASNCEAEGSDTCQIVVLSGYVCEWIGGSIFAGGHTGAGVQIGQVSGLTPFNGQRFGISGGLTTFQTPNFYKFDTEIHQISNANGSLYLQNDGAVGTFKAVVDHAASTPVITGTPSALNKYELTGRQNGAIYRYSYDPAFQPEAIYDGDLSQGTASTLAAGTGTTFYVPVNVVGGAVLTGYRVQFGVGGNGHWEAAIYNDNAGQPGTYVSASDTGNPIASATGVQSQNCFASAQVQLPAGKYWLAFYLDNTTDTVYQTALTNSSMGACYTESGRPPTGAHGTLTRVATKMKVIGLVLNGWS